MKNKDAVIVRYLIENKNKELNIRNISEGTGMDYKNVHSIIKRLEKNKLVNLEVFGQSNRVRLISQIHPILFEAEYNRQNDMLKDKNIAVLLNELKKAIKTKIYVLLIFGSYAKRTQSKGSDMDLMLIVPDGTNDMHEKEVHKSLRSLPLPLHFLVFSESQFAEMINSNDLNVGKEALENNIILYGIEQYYEMI